MATQTGLSLRAGDFSPQHWLTWVTLIADQTVRNILRRHGIALAPKRRRTTTWRNFTAAHMSVMSGADFFTVEVLTWRGLVTYYVFFFLHFERRRVNIARITRHPNQAWMEQIARSATQQDWGHLGSNCYVLHDRDTKFCASFRSILADGGVEAIPLPAPAVKHEGAVSTAFELPFLATTT